MLINTASTYVNNVLFVTLLQVFDDAFVGDFG